MIQVRDLLRDEELATSPEAVREITEPLAEVVSDTKEPFAQMRQDMLEPLTGLVLRTSPAPRVLARRPAGRSAPRTRRVRTAARTSGGDDPSESDVDRLRRAA